MRVLHIGKFFPPYSGGIERSSADLTSALAARGVGVAMLAHAPPGTHRTQSLDTNGVQVTLAACHGQFLYAPISPTFPFLLARTIRTFKPDLLHLHMPNTSAFWTLLSASARKLPWIVHWHSDIPLDSNHALLRLAYRVYKPWEQALLRRARAIIATSQPYLEASTALSSWRSKVRVVPLGIAEISQPTARNPALWPGTGLRILAVGRLSYYKGFDILLRALADVAEAQLLLIGSGECESTLRALAQQLGLADRVHFAGKVDDASVAEAFAQADIFCLPSIERAEAFGLVLLEAMRARLPVVASAIRGSGVVHVVRNGETGLLVPPHDPAALAAALSALAKDTDLRRRFGENGHRRWREEFTLESCVQRTLEVYREAMDRKSHRATAVSAL